MASIRKKVSTALGFNSGPSSSISKPNSADGSRGSLDSGYHSMIAKPKPPSHEDLSEASTFFMSDLESSPERSPRKLHKTISTTFSGALHAISKTVRSTTSYIYPTPSEPDLPSNEWSECETPKKESRRSSIMSSVRKRTQRFTPRTPDAKVKSPEPSHSPVPMTQEKAPALDVAIPNPCLSSESLRRSQLCRGSQLLTGVKLPAGPKNLWPGPTRLTVDQASSGGKKGMYPVPLKSSPETKNFFVSDGKGYLSEVESNADVSEFDGLPPACSEHEALGLSEDRTGSPCQHHSSAVSHIHVASSGSPRQRSITPPSSSPAPLESTTSELGTLEGNVEQRLSLYPLSRSSSHRSASLDDGLKALFPSREDAATSKSKPVCDRSTSDLYDADAESVHSSMGSRTAWERHRADRERRYMEIVDMDSRTESDEEVGSDLQLGRSPSKKPVHYAGNLCLNAVNIGESETTTKHPNGALHYAVEAIEKPAFPVGDLSYAVEAIERPSVTTFDPFETVLQQRPMLHLSAATDEQAISQVPEPQDSSPFHGDVPASPSADLSPSRVELPFSPENIPANTPVAHKSQLKKVMSTDEEVMVYGAGSIGSRSTRQVSSKSDDVPAGLSPEQQSSKVRENVYESILKAEDHFVPTYLAKSLETGVGESAYEAGLRAANLSTPVRHSDIVQSKPAVGYSHEGEVKATSFETLVLNETSYGTYREQFKARSPLSESRSLKGTSFEHNRAVSAFSDDTDDSCTITTQSPACNASPPLQSVRNQSEPAHRLSSITDALAAHGDKQICIAGSAGAGIDASLLPLFDNSGDQDHEAGSKSISSKTLETSPSVHVQLIWSEQHSLPKALSDTPNSMQSSIDSDTSHKTFNAAKLPNFVSPSVIASSKARRKIKKSSSAIKSIPLADLTMNPRNVILEPEFNPHNYELDEDSALGEMQTSNIGGSRVTKGGAQKPSLNRQFGRKGGRGQDQTSFEEFSENAGASLTWLDPSSKERSSKKKSRGKPQVNATFPVTLSPPQMKASRVRDQAKPCRIHGTSGGDDSDSSSTFEPELNTVSFGSKGDFYHNRRSGSTSYGGHELFDVFQDNPSVCVRNEENDELEQSSDKKAVKCANGDETIGNESEAGKDSPRAPTQKRSDRLPLEAEKKVAVQKELERKSDHACSRLAAKLKSGALGDDHVRRDNSPHKDGRPPWRP